MKYDYYKKYKLKEGFNIIVGKTGSGKTHSVIKYLKNGLSNKKVILIGTRHVCFEYDMRYKTEFQNLVKFECDGCNLENAIRILDQELRKADFIIIEDIDIYTKNKVKKIKLLLSKYENSTKFVIPSTSTIENHHLLHSDSIWKDVYKDVIEELRKYEQ